MNSIKQFFNKVLFCTGLLVVLGPFAFANKPVVPQSPSVASLLALSPQTSAQYNVQLLSIISPKGNATFTRFPLNAIHSWLIKIENTNGTPVVESSIGIKGGMEAHGHALPTSPKVIATNKPGEYKIHGLKFQMIGEWFVELTIQDTDTIRFDFEVQP